MKERRNADIPIFLHIEDTVSTFIINNELIGCMYSGGRQRWPNKAFTILRQLYESPITRNQLPKRFCDYFLNTEDIHSEKPYHCLIGEDFTPIGIDYLCLTINVKVRENKDLPVLVSNFELGGDPLNHRIELSSKEAFFIFSNILSNTRCISYDIILDKTGKEIFDGSIIEKYIVSQHQHSSSLIAVDCFDRFVLSYIDFLQEQLLSDLICPNEILRLSGARLLVLLSGLEPVSRFMKKTLKKIEHYNSLSINETAMYFTLLRSLHAIKGKKFPSVEKFFREENITIAGLEEKIIKYF